MARLQHMNHDVLVGGRNALTPVLHREDAIREWERRQSGKAAAAVPYPQLEYLQQQAELAASSLGGWTVPSTSNRYAPASSSGLSNSFQPSTAIAIDDTDRRDTIMSNVRSAARGEQPSMYTASAAAAISSPPQAYTGSNRYGSTAYNAQQVGSSPSPFDSLDRRTDIGTLYVPMQPDQYQTYGQTSPSHTQQQHNVSAPHHAPSSSASGVQGYYASAPGLVPTGSSNGQRNPFTGPAQTPPNVVDSRRTNGMDVWPR